jgi:hypothetical protein
MLTLRTQEVRLGTRLLYPPGEIPALKKRRQLMDAWGRYVEGTANVVTITRSA